MQDIFDPACGLSIHETADKETWVRCGKSALIRNAAVATAIMVVVILLLLFFSASPGTIIVVFLVAGALVSFAWFNAIVAAKPHLETEWDRYENRISQYTSNGATRFEARQRVRQDTLMQQQVDAATMQANALNRSATSQSWQTTANIGSMFMRK